MEIQGKSNLPSIILPFIRSSVTSATWDGSVLSFQLPVLTPPMAANIVYFGHPEWANNYLAGVHRDSIFRDRWYAATESWVDKIVVDIGCGPGNVYATLRSCVGQPKLLIGVDISHDGLLIAKKFGYFSILADAHQLPLIESFADLVTLNATLHHCENMHDVLREAARIVRPGGKLIVDQDPQKTMWKNNWLTRLIWRGRLPFYRFLRRGGHSNFEEQFWAQLTEIHHQPGDGVTPEFFCKTLEPLGFKVQIYRHNRTAGANALQGEMGTTNWNIRLAQRLGGVNPNNPEGAMVVMCVATRLA